MSTQAVTPQVQQMLGDATMKFAFRDFHGAAALLLEVVRICPGVPHPYQTLGLIYEEMEQPKKALKLYTMAAQLSQRDAQQWRHLAALATRENEITQAIYSLGRVIAIDPDDANALWEQSALLLQAGQQRKAASALASLLTKRPSDAHVMRRLGSTYLALAQPEKAAEMLESALSAALASLAALRAGGAEGVVPSSEAVAAAEGAADHVLHMLLEAHFACGAYRDGVEAVEAARQRRRATDAAGPSGGGRATGEGALPLELLVKEGVCYAYLEE